jgi:hypothetical protein
MAEYHDILAINTCLQNFDEIWIPYLYVVFHTIYTWENDCALVQWGDNEIVALCNSKDSAHIVANFDTLPSATKLFFIHEILGTKSLLGWQHVYQISKLEDW